MTWPPSLPSVPIVGLTISDACGIGAFFAASEAMASPVAAGLGWYVVAPVVGSVTPLLVKGPPANLLKMEPRWITGPSYSYDSREIISPLSISKMVLVETLITVAPAVPNQSWQRVPLRAATPASVEPLALRQVNP